MHLLSASLVAAAALICAGEEMGRDAPRETMAAGGGGSPVLEPAGVGPDSEAKGETGSPDEMLKLNTVVDREGSDKTPKIEAAVEVKENEKSPDQKIIGKDTKGDPEESVKKSNTEKQKDQTLNKNELSHIVNDFLNKIFQVPVDLFKTIKEVIKDLTTRLQNSLPQPDPQLQKRN